MSLAETSERASPGRILLAWGVHAFTASGAVLGVLAILALASGAYERAALLMLVALAVDSVDGALARAARVDVLAPRLDGRRLDDIIDYLNYAVVPAVFLVVTGVVGSWLWAALPVLASAYGFAHREAKTQDHFFLGFPSYWNVVAVYLWIFRLSEPAAAAVIALLAAAVVVPFKWIHPSQLSVWRRTTNLAGAAWIAVMALAVLEPAPVAGWPLAEISLLYPVWYTALSVRLGDWLGGPHRGDA